MEKIDPAHLVPMDVFLSTEPITIDLVYADADHPRNIFQEAIYQPNARLWAHKDLAAIILLTARLLNKKHGWIVELKDCLRTVDAQAAMQKTEIVKANPQWCLPGPDRLLSPPGKGAHPRAMAIDVCVYNSIGCIIDMGTPFDDMSPASARDYGNLPKDILENRNTLNAAFIKSAEILGQELYLVPPEWWDFRMPAETYKQYDPLREADLPPQMQMTSKTKSNIPDFDATHFNNLAHQIRILLEPANANI